MVSLKFHNVMKLICNFIKVIHFYVLISYLRLTIYLFIFNQIYLFIFKQIYLFIFNPAPDLEKFLLSCAL